MAINIQILQKDGYDVVNFEGAIDAEAEVHLGQLLSKINDKIIFNFKNVSSINSCGVEVGSTFKRCRN